MNHLLKRLSGGLLALCLLSTTAFAARITPSVNTVELNPEKTAPYNLDQSMETQVPVGVPISFTDVLAGRWYAEPVVWAVQSGLISGTDDGRLCSLDNAGRAQVPSILMNYMDNFIL